MSSTRIERTSASHQQYRTWRVAYEALHATLTAAQQQRDLRRDLDDRGMPGWVEHETQVMLIEVNRLRRLFGRPPVLREHIDAKEQLALGHVDYTVKWCIGCADLVVA